MGNIKLENNQKLKNLITAKKRKWTNITPRWQLQTGKPTTMNKLFIVVKWAKSTVMIPTVWRGIHSMSWNWHQLKYPELVNLVRFQRTTAKFQLLLDQVKPRQADEELSHQELERRNRRRMRNREAAQRQRERRLNKVDNLEREVNSLTSENSNLLSENEQLKKELENLKFQLSLQIKSEPSSKPLAVLNTHNLTNPNRDYHEFNQSQLPYLIILMPTNATFQMIFLLLMVLLFWKPQPS